MSTKPRQDRHSALPTPSCPKCALERYRDEFCAKLEEQHYAKSTRGNYTQAVNCLIDLMRQRSISVGDLDKHRVMDLKHALQQIAAPSGRAFVSRAIERFVSYLVEVGASAPIESADVDDTPRGRLRREYEAYLRHQRGHSEATIHQSWRITNQFLTFCFRDGLGDLSKITSNDSADFLHHLITHGTKPFLDKTPPSFLRSFFQFLFWSGKSKKNLTDSVPRVKRPQQTNLPRYVTPEQVQMLLDAVRADDVIGRRNYAMLLIVARLGLRAPEVIAIQLDDIDWHAGEILIRGKGQLHDRMPLPQDVGEALVDYIKNGRKASCRTLFVSSNAPHQPFCDGQVVNRTLQVAFAKSELTPPARYVGSHVLRHSLATDLLRRGASLTEIGQVLRHRSSKTTAIYAKYDVDSLRSIALPWPIEGGAQ